MSGKPAQTVYLADLTEEDKLQLALELMEETANLAVQDDVFRTLMTEAGNAAERGPDGWVEHILQFLSIGTYVSLVRA